MAILASSTASNIANQVNYQLMKGLLSAARKRLPFFNGTLPGTLQKNKSTASVLWERIDNLAPSTTAFTEPTGITAAFFGRSTVLPTVSTATAAMAKYGNAVLLSEEVELQQMNVRSAALMDTLGANAGESLNLLMESIYSGLSHERFANGSVGGTTATTGVIANLSLTDIQWARNFLNRNSAMTFTADVYGSDRVGSSPIRNAYYGICHPDVEETIRGLSGFVSVEQYGGHTATIPFEFGTVGGVRFCSTEVIPVMTGAGTTSVTGNFRGATVSSNDVYKTYIYGRECIGSVGLGNMHATNSYEMYDPKTPPAVEVIVKPKGTIGTDLYNEMTSIAWKAWFAGSVLNQSWGVKIYSLAPDL